MAEDDKGQRLRDFIEAQAALLKTMEPEDVPLLRLQRSAAALADVTGETPPDPESNVILGAWQRTPTCHHFWGPTIGGERFCTKCQVPNSAVDEPSPPRRRR